MAESHVVSGLIAKRSELAGQVAHLQKQMTLLQGGLAHLDATIKLFSPEYNLRSIRPKQVRQRNHYFDRGEGQRLALSALREIGEPARLAVIAQKIVGWKGFDEAERAGVEHSLDAILRRAETAGLIQRVSRDAHGIVWQIAPLAQ